MGLVRQTRDDVAARALVKAPAVLSVNVHPTLEAFGHETGQPWWVTAATVGSAIDLAPISHLRQRGVLESTAALRSGMGGRRAVSREGARVGEGRRGDDVRQSDTDGAREHVAGRVSQRRRPAASGVRWGPARGVPAGRTMRAARACPRPASHRDPLRRRACAATGASATTFRRRRATRVAWPPPDRT